MKYLRTIGLVILAWIVFFVVAFFTNLLTAVSLYLGALLVIGVLLVAFPEKFIRRDPPIDTDLSTSIGEIISYLESQYPGHRILRRQDTYTSKKFGEQTRTLLYSHSLTLQDWIDLVEFYDLDYQGWKLYAGRNGSFGIRKYKRN